ncbi:MAG: phospholipid carrier-dependent glycosyltransferase [Candidatus Pacebacteria bacterium]|jgi:dolichyl-phosphate-mannose-protein mannosyltransferase|nr:phospholipid carrier-dependent glycosyltransferase [Candidatus Paceibacterota bacterium]MBT3511837.1 phospholipid carrier-dependent glycosyltransferase [Candidatus Paceibacterota bacterium]MBT4005053.1 phospholipid carrier-dependent glycosyltransferase [Candidatus Paceibacterota bacterium]MBT4359294.1 phospholipid carrier-dependent glycosyltransferase [Candidatus Paceibacterota bacterium]MBT4680871.1 phospholipid carrier-dependent glycosyltransferase [Candidatus Paceibacterota bacterium]
MRIKNGPIILAFILFFSFVARIYRLHVPDRYIFDEVYHVITFKLIAANDPRAFEWWHGAIEPNTAIDWLHPPLAKYTQGFFIKILGSSSFSWRISSALFGVGVIWAIYKLSQKLFNDQRISLLAAGLASLDGLLLVQSRIAMNDIHVTFFILLTFISYLSYKKNPQNKRLFLTGLLAGLAMSSKWSGTMAVMVICLLETIDWLKRFFTKKIKWNELINQGLLMVIALGLIPFTVYILSYGQMFLQGKGWNHFTKLHNQIWWYQTNLTATHGYQSQPWQWFLNIKPVWFHVDYPSNDQIANIYSIGNPAFHWVGVIAVVMTIFFLIFRKLNHKKSNREVKNLNWLLITYLFLWLPWQLSPRIMFYYHYTPAVPLLAIIIAYWLIKIWSMKVKKDSEWNKITILVTVLLISIVFAVWYPQWTAIPMPKNFVDAVYYAIPSWK